MQLLVVSEAFKGKALLERHRMVNAAISQSTAAALPPPIHALSISAKTPEQFKPGDEMQSTPNCKGGAGK
jgi:stress-induced morphogen